MIADVHNELHVVDLADIVDALLVSAAPPFWSELK